MSTSKVIYLNDLRTSAEHIASKNSIITDAPVDNHGKGEAFSPTDLAATSLGSCMITVLGIYAQANAIDMKGTTAEITKIMSKEGPRRIVEIIVDLIIRTTEEMDEKQKTILERVARTCPVSLSLHPDIHQDIRISFVKS
ncbi:MAG TPA: OsmC family protein [Bacteroidia bacterium]